MLIHESLIAALDQSGLTIVPKVPTKEMLQAATMIAPTWDDDASLRKWNAMLSAAPKPE